MISRPRARLVRVAITGPLLAAALLSSCAHVTREDVVIRPTPQAGALATAQQSFAAARDAMLTAVAHLPDAARRLDAIDGDCARGAYDPAKAAQPGATTAIAQAGTALKDLPKLATAEASALEALATAGRSSTLDAAQQSAVAAVVTAARAEVAEVRSLAKDQKAGWSAYAQLWDAETEWIYRAGAGFFPSQVTGGYDAQVAGQAYAARTNPLRAAVEHERAGLSEATAALAHDADAVTAAIDAATSAFPATP